MPKSASINNITLLFSDKRVKWNTKPIKSRTQSWLSHRIKWNKMKRNGTNKHQHERMKPTLCEIETLCVYIVVIVVVVVVGSGGDGNSNSRGLGQCTFFRNSCLTYFLLLLPLFLFRILRFQLMLCFFGFLFNFVSIDSFSSFSVSPFRTLIEERIAHKCRTKGLRNKNQSVEAKWRDRVSNRNEETTTLNRCRLKLPFWFTLRRWSHACVCVCVSERVN